MNPIFKRRNLADIIAARKNPQSTKINTADLLISPFNELQGSDSQIEWLLKKATFNNEDKIYLLRYIEKKYRLYFSNNYNHTLLRWVIAKDQTVIDKNYDSKKKSYFVLKGIVTISERTAASQCGNTGNNNDVNSDKGNKNQVIADVNAGAGIGKIFSENSYSRCILQSQNAIFMQFDHGNGQLEFIEKNCFLTRKERQTVIGKSSLFSSVQAVNKYYLPLFLLKKYGKDDYIYKIGDQSQYLYLIVDGEINFESKVYKSSPSPSKDTRSTDHIKKNDRKTDLFLTTESLSTMSYFGQEQILQNLPRHQNARCQSLSCLLFLIPLEIVEKLMFYPDVMKTLKISAAIRQSKRNQKLTTISLLQSHQNHQHTQGHQNNQDIQSSSPIDFEDFKTNLYKNHSNKQKYKHPKISLANHNKLKVIHGNSITKLPAPPATNPEIFSMLKVNMETYNSTIKRFRFSLDVLHNHNRCKTEEIRGRSMSQVCKVLNLAQKCSEKPQIPYEYSNEGMDYYDAHIRFCKQLQTLKSYKTKTSKKNELVKTQCIKYLKEMI